jgi:hypothetical protein
MSKNKEKVDALHYDARRERHTALIQADSIFAVAYGLLDIADALRNNQFFPRGKNKGVEK